MILVSACLAGIPCRYDGGSNLVPEIRQLVAEGKAVTVCPEVLGGLPTPRIPSERRGDKVINKAGEDVTEAFLSGAEKAFEIAREHDCKTAVLKARSPSCGHGCIYNGSFNGTLVQGNGVAAQMLLKNGIRVQTEEEFLSGKTIE
ncbi:MAG: DUF523 domain-containing protein [Oscillospiraceae bacterium]|nr:DUF523 domain-containing protein [Oscillospiraceae bacterium]